MSDSWREAYLGWLKANVKRGDIRQALSHADHNSTMERSYPYLSRWWQGKGSRFEEKIRYHASALAQSNINHKDGLSLGVLAHQLQGRISKDSVETRILVMYGQGLKGLHKNTVSLLRLAKSNNLNVDYGDLLFLYLNWDKTNKSGVKYARSKLLNDFYGNIDMNTEESSTENQQVNTLTENKEKENVR